MTKKGVDISKWQGNINWQKAKNDGVDFAIIREGYGKESPTQKDKTFEDNYSGCKASGIPVGVYHYSYADCVNDAILEAKFCLKNISGKQFEYPICFDIEDKEMLKLSTRTRTDIVKAFCKTIEQNGYYTMFYCNANWLKNYLYKDELVNKYDLWLAHWNVSVPAFACGIWQKCETGKIDGINGNVDLNEAYKDYETIIKNKGLNGFKSGSATIPPSTPSPTNKTYTVNKGESLWTIAQKQLGDGTKWKQIYDLNNLKNDVIYPDQVLKIPN